jgi:hypothetical protein
MADGTVLVIEQYGNHPTAILSLGVYIPPLSGYTVLLLHPRGHGNSEGRWSGSAHMEDVQQLIAHYKQRYATVYLLAAGEQANLLLLHERESGTFPDGMILLHPTNVERIHVQTPTIIFANGFLQLHNVSLRSWPQAHLERLQALKHALEELTRAERPIRFKAR